jgi:hypothetical protein
MGISMTTSIQPRHQILETHYNSKTSSIFFSYVHFCQFFLGIHFCHSLRPANSAAPLAGAIHPFLPFPTTNASVEMSNSPNAPTTTCINSSPHPSFPSNNTLSVYIPFPPPQQFFPESLPRISRVRSHPAVNNSSQVDCGLGVGCQEIVAEAEVAVSRVTYSLES